ncbi:MAG: hypothetical protein ACRC2K_13980 [Clostridium sp.]
MVNYFRTAQPFSLIYLMNNTGEKLKDIYIRLENYQKEVHIEKMSKGAVLSRFLMIDNLKGERNVYLYHFDEVGNKHEYLLISKFNCENIQKIKVRLQKINEDKTFKIESFIDDGKDY